MTPDELAVIAERLGVLAGQLAAGTAEYLRVLGEFDAAEGWALSWGARSGAHWLSWRSGVDLRTAREHIRVARALRGLPVTAAAFAQGRLSYSKVRAISRVCTAETEEDLVRIARHAPATMVDRLCRGLVSVAERGGEPAELMPETTRRWLAEREQGRKRVRWAWDEGSGELVVWGRLCAADGAVLLAAMTRAEHERTRTLADDTEPVDGEAGADGPAGLPEHPASQAPANPTPGGDAVAHENGPAGPPADPAAEAAVDLTQSEDREPCADGPAGPSPEPAADAGAEAPGERAPRPDLTGPAPGDLGPALVVAALMILGGVPAPVHAPAAEVLFVHGPVTATAGAAGAVPTRPNGPAGPSPVDNANTAFTPPPPAAGTCEHTTRVYGGPGITGPAASEALCDAVARAVNVQGGAVLSWGRRLRKASRAQLRALHLRDMGCRTPGCGRTKFLHAHHVIYWSRGGLTDLDNLILLCGACHRAVHDGVLIIQAHGGQRFTFHDNTGKVIDPAPPVAGTADAMVARIGIGPFDAAGHWNGDGLDLSLATSWLLHNWSHDRHHRTTDDHAA